MSDITNLKEQVLYIEENYVDTSELKNYVSKSEFSKSLNGYATKSEIESEILSNYVSINNVGDVILNTVNQSGVLPDLSGYVTLSQQQQLSNEVDKKIESISNNLLTMNDVTNSVYKKNEVFTKNETLSEIEKITSEKTSGLLTVDYLSQNGYVTETELSSKKYVSKSDLNLYATTSWVESTINNQIDNRYLSLINTFDQKTNQLKSSYETIINEKVNGLVTMSEVDEKISSISNNYVEKDNLVSFISSVGYITGDDLNRRGYITKQDLDIRGYVTLDDISGVALQKDVPTKLSQLKNDVGYLTKHQSLSNYVLKVELSDYIKIDDIDKVISDKSKTIINDRLNERLDKYPTLQFVSANYLLKSEKPNLSGYAKLTDISDFIKKQDFINNIKDFITIKDIPELSKFVKISDLEKLEFVKKEDIPNVNDFVKSRIFNSLVEEFKSYKESLKGFLTRKEIEQLFEDFISKHKPDTDSNEDNTFNPELIEGIIDKKIEKIKIPTRLSQLLNDSGFISQHQSLKGYALKTDLLNYVTKTEFDGVVSDLHDEIKSHVQDLSNYTTKDYVSKNFLLKSEKPNLSGYAKLTDLNGYVKISSLPNWNDFVTFDKLPDLSSFVTYDYLNQFEFKTDDIDLSEYVKSSNLSTVLKLYVKKQDFDKYVEDVDRRGYVVKSDMDDYLSPYLKITDLPKYESGLNVDKVNDLINYQLDKLSIPKKTSQLINDSGFLTKSSLNNYPTKTDMLQYAKISDIVDDYIRKDDFVLPSDLVHIKDIEDFVTEGEFKTTVSGLLTKVVAEQKYATKESLDSAIGRLGSTVEYLYLKKEDYDVKIDEFIKNVENIYSDYPTYEDLKIYATTVDLDTKTSELKYALTTYLPKDTFNSYLNKIYDKINEVKSNSDNSYARKEDVQGQISNVVNNFDTLFTDYYNKDESHLKFLSKEDYRGIKQAATLNYEYNDYPDLFFDVIHNIDNIKVNDGLYIIEDKAFVLKNNKIVPMCANKTSTMWEIEEEDINWKDYNDFEDLSSEIVDMSKDLLYDNTVGGYIKNIVIKQVDEYLEELKSK